MVDAPVAVPLNDADESAENNSLKEQCQTANFLMANSLNTLDRSNGNGNVISSKPINENPVGILDGANGNGDAVSSQPIKKQRSSYGRSSYEDYERSNSYSSWWSWSSFETQYEYGSKEDCKGVMCKYHAENRCKYGAECLFAHSLEEKNLHKKRKTSMCYFHEQNMCKYGEYCDYAHSADELPELPNEDEYWYSNNLKFKRVMCAFDAVGMCKYGKDCGFAHSSDKLVEVPEPAPWSYKVAVGKDDNAKVAVCAAYQYGCCRNVSCPYKHEMAPPDSGYKTMRCAQFVESKRCSKADCFFAHGDHELRTPKVLEGVVGYKACLCSFYVLENVECGEVNSAMCFDAHGELDLRRNKESVPKVLDGAAFTYADAHVHMDEVLLSRRYGALWFYKSKLCRWEQSPENCTQHGCCWAHGKDDLWPRQLIEKQDLLRLTSEISAMPGGTLAGCVHTCCEEDTIELSMDLVRWGEEALGGRLYVSFGIHPSQFEQYTPEVEKRILAAIDECGKKAVAWGECGLDYYRRQYDIKNDATVKDRMKDAFMRQLRAAVRRGLPLVIQSRDAEEDTLEILRQELPRDHHVYLHSLMASMPIVNQILEAFPNSFIGVVGALTYEPAGHLCEMAGKVPLSRLLLETDGPYMAPGQFQGEESHPGQIPWIAEAVAKAKGISTLEVLEVTTANFRRFYRLS